jgi:hypothetical protein
MVWCSGNSDAERRGGDLYQRLVRWTRLPVNVMARHVRATGPSAVPGKVARTSRAMTAPLEHRSLTKADDITPLG